MPATNDARRRSVYQMVGPPRMDQGIAPDGVPLREHRAFKGDDPAVDAHWEKRFDK